MAQYVKSYEKGKHLINLDYVKQIFTTTITVNNIPSKELVFIDNTDNVILRFQGRTAEYMDDILAQLEKFISAKEDTIFYLY